MNSKKLVTRRTVIQTGMTVLAGTLTATSVAAQDADEGKMAKSVVQYRYHPSANGSHCGICANFIAPESCKVVAGKIDPNGYCLAFAAKKSG